MTKLRMVDIINGNIDNGQFYFSKGSMRMFGTTLSKNVYEVITSENTNPIDREVFGLFVTGDDNFSGDKHLYTIKYYSKGFGIGSFSAFLKYDKIQQAKYYAEKYANKLIELIEDGTILASDLLELSNVSEVDEHTFELGLKNYKTITVRLNNTTKKGDE
jgi:hypothetical protein